MRNEDGVHCKRSKRRFNSSTRGNADIADDNNYNGDDDCDDGNDNDNNDDGQYDEKKNKRPLFSDEGSGAEVVLRPGDSVIVRGASQLRGHLVGLFGNLNGEHFCALL